MSAAIDRMARAIEAAIDDKDTNISNVLSVITGVFVGLTVSLVKAKGGDEADTRDICVDGGDQRDITIHAPRKA